MKFPDDLTAPLPLVGGVVQQQRLVVPAEVIRGLRSWRHACRLAWRLRSPRITLRTFAELTGCYVSHCSDYFSAHESRRELPAGKAGITSRVLGNTVLQQYLAHDGATTLVEELMAERPMGRAA